MFLCKSGQNPPIGSGDRVQTRLIFTVFIVWLPWKLGQGLNNLTNSFNYPNDTMHKVSPESIIWFKRQSADKLFFWSKFDIQSAGVTLQMRSMSPKSKNFVRRNGVSGQVWWKSTNWFKRQSADKSHFYNLYSVVNLKTMSRSPKSNQIFKPSNVTIYEVWPESVIWFKR